MNRYIQDRWGDSLKHGFVVVPSELFKQQRKLQLDCNELVVVMNLLTFWHSNDEPPILSLRALEERMGLGTRSLQRLIKSLETKGLISVEKGVGERRVNLQLIADKLAQQTKTGQSD